MEHLMRSFESSFYVSLCWYCMLPGSMKQPLQRCGGCELLAYCNRDCQKPDRPFHKNICKEFPVVKTHGSAIRVMKRDLVVLQTLLLVMSVIAARSV